MVVISKHTHWTNNVKLFSLCSFGVYEKTKSFRPAGFIIINWVYTHIERTNTKDKLKFDCSAKTGPRLDYTSNKIEQILFSLHDELTSIGILYIVVGLPTFFTQYHVHAHKMSSF